MFLFFDLDGTLVDSGPGIKASFSTAFKELGLSPLSDDSEVNTLIGPPLERTFARFLPQNKIEEAIQSFRAYYKEKGIGMAEPYQGIQKSLETLLDQGHTLAITTSKNELMAKQMLKNMKLDSYFLHVFGALPNSHDKIDVLQRALIATQANLQDSYIIGDTLYDMKAGQDLGITSVGVLWGYGTKDSLLENGSQILLKETEELATFLQNKTKF